MKKAIGPALTLLFLSPVCGELLSSSSPPGEFFNPVVFTLLVALYGCGALLVREIAWRWRKGWPSIVLLGMAYGIFEEGILVRSFFDPTWPDLGILAEYGRWNGVNWVWVINLTVYHAFISITLPILLTTLIFPVFRDQAWLSRRSITICAVIFLVTAPFGVLFGMLATPVMLLGCVLVILALVMLANIWPTLPARTAHPAVWQIFLSGLGWMVLFMLVMWALPNGNIPVMLSLTAALLMPALAYWLFLRLGGACWTEPEQWAWAAGSLLPWITVAFLTEADIASRLDNTSGMGLVGLVFLLFLVWLRWKVSRRVVQPL